MKEYSNLSVLIIDPSPGMRGSMHNMLNQSQITKIDYAVSSGTAIKQIAKKSYDLILCEYDLGNGQDGQDGQQLLEDLRHHRLIGMWTIFIMITSESVYSKVVSAAELAPTDYILKPFTVDVLVQRIGRALEKRTAFLPIYQLIGQGNMREAIKATHEAEEKTPRYGGDFARLRAELQLSMGEAGDAEQTYIKIAEARPVGWAKLGLAKTQFMQNRHAEAEQTLTDLIAGNDKLMDAYDWLAKTHEAQNKPQEAQRVLESAVAISPHVVRRLRKLGEVALDAGDADAAERNFKQVVAKAKYSEFRDPEDHVNLVKALVRKGDTAQAGAVVRDLEKSLRGHEKLAACRALSSAVVAGGAGDGKAAQAELDAALTELRGGAALSPPARLLLARSCMEQKMDAPATELMHDLVNDPTSGVSMGQAKRAFEQAGRADLGAGFDSAQRQQIEQLLQQGAKLLAERDFRGAAMTMYQAARRAPQDARVQTGAVNALVRCMDELGWDGALADQARVSLALVRSLEPDSAQTAELAATYQALQRKYGIAA
ncbi:MAG TPA: response regulator [Burkholderiaceae bacterium]